MSTLQLPEIPLLPPEELLSCPIWKIGDNRFAKLLRRYEERESIGVYYTGVKVSKATKNIKLSGCDLCTHSCHASSAAFRKYNNKYFEGRWRNNLKITKSV